MKVSFQYFDREVKKRGKKYKKAFDKVLKSHWYILGPEVKNFETEFAKFNHSKFCIGVANGLEAIQIALMALDIKEGDEVITTPISAVATTIAILSVKATPIFCDTDENGLLDINKVNDLITKKTKAILPVHLYGNPVDIIKLKNIAKANNISIIEDAAQAHGAKIKDKYVGNFGDIGCFSFYPTKNLGAIGDAGAIVTNSKILYEKMLMLRDYGQSSKYVHQVYGLNSRLDELQASILSVKLKFLEKDNNHRAKIAQIYKKINEKPYLKFLKIPTTHTSCYHQFVVLVNNRKKFIDHLKKHNIDTLIHYPTTIVDQPMFENKYKDTKLDNAREFVNKVVSLPINPFLSKKEVKYVLDIVNSYEE